MNEFKQVNQLPLERNQSLKIFGIVCVSTSIPTELLKDKLTLTVIASYSQVEAFENCIKVLTMMGKNPNEYRHLLTTQMEAKEVIDVSAQKEVTLISKPERKKTVEETMVDNIRIVFNLVGTAAQKKTMESVIEKFVDYSSKKK